MKVLSSKWRFQHTTVIIDWRRSELIKFSSNGGSRHITEHHRDMSLQTINCSTTLTINKRKMHVRNTKAHPQTNWSKLHKYAKDTANMSPYLLSAQCVSSVGRIIKSVCVSVSESVSPSHKTSWTLYRSQSSTDLHQTCHQGRVPGDVVTYCFWWKSEIFLSTKQSRSGINPHHCSYGKISLMSNISKMVSDTMLDSKEVR